MRSANYQPRLIYPDIPQMDLSDYERGLDEFIQSFSSRFQGEAAFYQFGQVRTPGVSDIDLLIVVRDQDWKRAIDIASQVRGSSGLLHFLFVHEPLVVCESLLPSLPILHTIEKEKLIRGDWEPLITNVLEFQDQNVPLLRHSVWNSFIRMAALELDGNTIGLRRTLSLMHNLLITALNGNSLLSVPADLSLSTDDIRQEILTAPAEKQESITMRWLDEVVGKLNEVDDYLNDELIDENFLEDYHEVIPTRDRFVIVNSIEQIEIDHGFHGRVLRNAKVIQVPAYLILITSLLANCVAAYDPELVEFRRSVKQEQFIKEIDPSAYAKHYRIAVHLQNQANVHGVFIKPFSHRISATSWKKRLLAPFRRYYLTRYQH